jgi:PEP-CTERM motif
MGELALRLTLLAPVLLIAALCLMMPGPVRAGSIGPEPEPPPFDTTPAAVLYSVDAGIIVLVTSEFDLSDLEGLPLPPDLTLVDLDDLTHGSRDAFAITGICVSDPLCNSKILGSGPGGRQTLVDALVSTYETIPFPLEPPEQPVPEPGTAALVGLGLCALAFAGRSRS